MGAVTTLGIVVAQCSFLAATLPAYNSVNAPSDSVGCVLLKGIGGALISLIDGGPFSHTVATDGRGHLFGATPVLDQSDGVAGQSVGDPGDLTNRQILWHPGVLSEGAARLAVDVMKGVAGGMNF